MLTLRLDRPTVLVTEPGPHLPSLVHDLLGQGAVVQVADPGPGADAATRAALDDLAHRGLVTLLPADDLDARGDAQVILRDPGRRPDAAPAAAPDAAPTSGSATGSVTLVGGGPGDPGLLTLAGLDAVRAADVLVCDRLAPLAVLAQARSDAEVVHVGKIPRGAFTPQEAINDLLLERARAGRRVVRLKGGDSYVFGRGGEEWNACVAAGIPVTVIPGVTSAVAVPALGGIPLTQRGVTQGFVVLSGHVVPGDPRSTVDWAALATSGLTLVVLMGAAALPAITAALIEHGLPADTPAAMIADGSMPSQRLVRATVATLAAAADDEGLDHPAVTVIGPVVTALADPLGSLGG